MTRENTQFKKTVSSKAAFIAFLFIVLLLIGNLNAGIDYFLHPDIPYFDREHLLVGGITSSVVAILFILVMVYARHLRQAEEKIKTLEAFLPICANCKKIRVSESNAKKKESWQPIESYITEHTDTKFSHGLCPECMKSLYPDYTDNSTI